MSGVGPAVGEGDPGIISTPVLSMPASGSSYPRISPDWGLMFVIRRLAGTGSWMRYHFFPSVLVMGLMGCAESIDHDEVLAGRRAEEFAQVAFVKQDVENGYALLSDGTRRYVSSEQFKEVLLKLHPRAFPKTVIASESEPMPGEKAIYIFLTGENSGEHFYYRLTMEGTATTGYRVLRLNRGSASYPPSNQKQKLSRQKGGADSAR
jgi:hypothetical protein